MNELSAYDRLSPKRRLFVDYFVGEAGCVKAVAARLAGYSPATASQAGWKIAEDPLVKQAIAERLSGVAASANEVLARLSDQLRGCIGWFYDIDEQTGKPKLNLNKPEAKANLHIIKEIHFGRDGNPMSVTLYDAQAAVAQLGKRYGLFSEKLDVEIRDDCSAASLERKLAGLAASLGAAGVSEQPDGAGAQGAAVPVEVLGEG